MFPARLNTKSQRSVVPPQPFQLDGESRKAVVVSTWQAEEWEELSSFFGVVLLQSLLVSDIIFV